jgi:hypothetical protein
MAKWNPMSTAPVGKEFLACIEVTNVRDGRKWWEQHVLYRDDEDGSIGPDHHKGWCVEDYTGWQELPAPPTGKARKLCESADCPAGVPEVPRG